MDIIPRGADGYYHPATEEQLQQLVAHASERQIPLRVRGSQHSVAQAIYTSGYEGEGAPPENAVTVMLDQYRKVTITPDEADPRYALVEVEAGCNLGMNPYDPTGTSTWKNSLNDMLQTGVDGHRYALSDLGGISHQTVSGFFSTGSSGGSIMYSVHDDLVRIRLIDGTGTIQDVSRDDPDPRKRDLFFAAGISMGLLGVISRMWLRAGPSFNVSGTQVTTSTADAPIDLFGDQPEKTSLETYLRETPYSRLMWWPQYGFKRIQIWQAERIEPAPDFVPKPYEELGRSPQLSALAGSLFYTLVGNLADISQVPSRLDHWYDHLDGTLSDKPDQNACAPTPSRLEHRKRTVAEVLAFLAERLTTALEKHPTVVPGSDIHHHAVQLATAMNARTAHGEDKGLPTWLSKLITDAIEKLLNGILSNGATQLLADLLAKVLPLGIKYILDPFVPLGTLQFQDTWMCGLPMDNQMDDQLWPTEFTELWIPVERATEAMKALQTFYDAKGNPATAYKNTGAFSCELYAAKASKFWMSPSYGGDVYRIDVFWFALNAGSPADSFYPMFWELLKPFSYKPHWGKYLPSALEAGVHYYRQVFPMLDRFLALRDTLDPKQIFLSDYWRGHFGIAQPR